MQSTKDVVRGSFDPALSDHAHGCQSSLLTLGGRPSDTVFFTQPLTPSRHTMTVHRSVDGGASWPDYMVVATGGASYSCMSTLPGDESRMGPLYERDGPLCTRANDTAHPTVARSTRAVCRQSCTVAGYPYRDSRIKEHVLRKNGRPETPRTGGPQHRLHDVPESVHMRRGAVTAWRGVGRCAGTRAIWNARPTYSV